VTEHVILLSSHTVIIPVGRAVTLALPHGRSCDTYPVETSEFWQFYQPASLQNS